MSLGPHLYYIATPPREHSVSLLGSRQSRSPVYFQTDRSWTAHPQQGSLPSPRRILFRVDVYLFVLTLLLAGSHSVWIRPLIEAWIQKPVSSVTFANFDWMNLQDILRI
jgi:hypothetical protein